MRFTPLIVSMGVLVYTAPCPAQSVSPTNVRWQVDLVAPADCLTLDQFVGMIRQRTPRIDAIGTSSSTAQMQVTVSREDSQVVGRIAIREVDGHESIRQLSGGSCEEVAGALALVAAVVVDPDIALARDDRAVVAPQPMPPLYPPSVWARSSAVPAPPPRRNVLAAGIDFGAFYGVAPGTVAMPLVFLEYRAERWAMSPGVRVSAGRAFTQHVNTVHGDARFSVISFRGEPCISLAEERRAYMRGCGIVMVNRLTGEGSRTVAPQTESRWWVGLGVGPRFGWVIGRTLVIEVGGGGTIELTRKLRYFFAPDTTAYTMSAWGAFAEGAVACQF